MGKQNQPAPTATRPSAQTGWVARVVVGNTVFMGIDPDMMEAIQAAQQRAREAQ